MDAVEDLGLPISIVQTEATIRAFTQRNGEAQTCADTIINGRFNRWYI
jgi:hypothetical protein